MTDRRLHFFGVDADVAVELLHFSFAFGAEFGWFERGAFIAAGANVYIHTCISASNRIFFTKSSKIVWCAECGGLAFQIVNLAERDRSPSRTPFQSRDRAAELTCLQSRGARFDSLAGLQ